ncbi:MAG: hypothetical protein RLZZ316_533, partial [Bacteroidota bacterium]
MKKLALYTCLFISVALINSCSKKIESRTDDTPALKPAKTDIDAGAWKTILLTSPTEFAVAAPAATTTPDYIAQVNEVKTWQQNSSWQ